MPREMQQRPGRCRRAPGTLPCSEKVTGRHCWRELENSKSQMGRSWLGKQSQFRKTTWCERAVRPLEHFLARHGRGRAAPAWLALTGFVDPGRSSASMQ